MDLQNRDFSSELNFSILSIMDKALKISLLAAFVAMFFSCSEAEIAKVGEANDVEIGWLSKCAENPAPSYCDASYGGDPGDGGTPPGGGTSSGGGGTSSGGGNPTVSSSSQGGGGACQYDNSIKSSCHGIAFGSVISIQTDGKITNNDQINGKTGGVDWGENACFFVKSYTTLQNLTEAGKADGGVYLKRNANEWWEIIGAVGGTPNCN